MNILEIFIQSMIITLILFPIVYPIVLRVSAICKKKRFIQIGPTCGFYALVYAVSKIKDINPKKEVSKIIKDSIMVDDSYVGEIFDLNLFVSIGRKYYPDIEINIKEFKNTEDLDALLKDYYLIYPMLSWKTPHYYFIDGESKKKYFFYSTDFTKRNSKKKVKIYDENKKMKNYMGYKWNQYFDRLIILRIFRWLQWSVWDKELYTFIRNNDKKKEGERRGKETPIDMFGRVVVVKKVLL